MQFVHVAPSKLARDMGGVAPHPCFEFRINNDHASRSRPTVVVKTFFNVGLYFSACLAFTSRPVPVENQQDMFVGS